MTHARVSIEPVQAAEDNEGSDGATAPDEVATGGGQASRREFLGLGPAALAAAAMVGGGVAAGGSPLLAATGDGPGRMEAGMTAVSKDDATIAGEPISYLATPNPEISSSIVTIPPGTATEWMIHPVQGYVFVLEGTLTVEYAEGPRKEFKAGHGFPQARSKWHRGRNDGETPVRFLGVFFGGKDVPNMLHPPRNR